MQLKNIAHNTKSSLNDLIYFGEIFSEKYYQSFNLKTCPHYTN